MILSGACVVVFLEGRGGEGRGGEGRGEGRGGEWGGEGRGGEGRGWGRDGGGEGRGRKGEGEGSGGEREGSGGVRGGGEALELMKRNELTEMEGINLATSMIFCYYSQLVHLHLRICILLQSISCLC